MFRGYFRVIDGFDGRDDVVAEARQFLRRNGRMNDAFADVDFSCVCSRPHVRLPKRNCVRVPARHAQRIDLGRVL